MMELEITEKQTWIGIEPEQTYLPEGYDIPEGCSVSHTVEGYGVRLQMPGCTNTTDWRVAQTGSGVVRDAWELIDPDKAEHVYMIRRFVDRFLSDTSLDVRCAKALSNDGAVSTTLWLITDEYAGSSDTFVRESHVSEKDALISACQLAQQRRSAESSD